eukprot:gene50-28_t
MCSTKSTCLRLKKLFTRDTIPLYIQMSLLTLIVVVSTVCFAYNVKDLKNISDSIYDAETAWLLAQGMLEVGKLPMLFGTPQSGEAPALTAIVEDLEKRIRVDLDFNELHQDIERMLTLSVSTDLEVQLEALDALQSITGLFNTELDQQATRQVGSAYIVQVGLECLSHQFLQLYFHYALLLDIVFVDWEAKDYQLYDGLRYDALAFPDCSGYLPLLKQFTFDEVIKNGPSTHPIPRLTQNYMLSPLTAEMLNDALLSLSSQVKEVRTSIEHYWNGKKKDSMLITVLLGACLLICVVLVILTPLFYAKGIVNENSGITEVFKVIEGKVRLLTVHAAALTTLKEDEKLYTFLDGTFLIKLLGFVRRARPYIPQTAFGDIENVVLSTIDNNASGNILVEHSAGNQVQETTGKDDQKNQELRTDNGLQIAVGTVLCLSSGGYVQNASSDDLKQLHCQSLIPMVEVLESIANTHHGAIHSITDRFVFMVWNVTSSCLDHELEALAAGLEILHTLQDKWSCLSISIASSLLSAGTVDESVQRAVMLCGSAALNRYHCTPITMDRNVGSKVFNVTLMGKNCCAVPISLYREERSDCLPGSESGRFRAGSSGPVIKSFPALMEEQKLEHMMELVERYRSRHMDALSHRRSTERRSTVSGAWGVASEAQEGVSLAATVDFWRISLRSLLEMDAIDGAYQ